MAIPAQPDQCHDDVPVIVLTGSDNLLASVCQLFNVRKPAKVELMVSSQYRLDLHCYGTSAAFMGEKVNFRSIA